MWNESGMNVTAAPIGCSISACSIVAPLFTLRTLRFSKTFKILKVSAPIWMLLPTETDSGILATYISVVNPALGESTIVDIVFVTNEVIPIL